MCVIAVAIKSEIPLNILRACQSSNPHGGGCSWIEGGLVRFQKDITASQMHQLLKDKPLPHVVHFRIATAGGVQPSRCHPFVIKTTKNDDLHGAAKSVLYHNGHCSGWEFYASMAGVGYPPDASDSQVIARIVAHRGEACLQEFVKRGAGKFAVMHSNGEVKLYGGFVELDGAMFSNTNWAHGLSCNPLHDKPKHGHGLGNTATQLGFKAKSHGGGHKKSDEPKEHKAYKPWWQEELDIARRDGWSDVHND